MRKTEHDVPYEKYLATQRHRSSKKFGKRYPVKVQFQKDFATMWEWAKGLMPTPNVIGCMGMKRNAEYEEFIKHVPSAEVFGVDIVPEVVETGKKCFCYDFNNLPEDWAEKFDLLYSNSLDHSFEVEKTVTEWTRVTKKGGFLIIEFSMSGVTDESDRYSFDQQDVAALFPAGKFRFVGSMEVPRLQVFIGVFQKL